MDNKALYNLSYGVFMLSTKTSDKANGCITNTCIQVASGPTRVAISVLNKNYTCDLIKKSGIFALSVLDQTVTFDTFKLFGYQSGRDVDKFAGMNLKTDLNGIPYLSEHTCSVISCKVVNSQDLTSHTLFIAEVVDAEVVSGRRPLTYADYQANVKPKPIVKLQESRKIIAWRCKICGYVYDSAVLPDDYICPICGHGADDFEPVYEK